MADYQDKDLTCRDCGKTFVWTAGEQEFYASKGFENPPTRCMDCRKAHKQERMSDRVKYSITCKNCGKQDEVPFKPRDPNDIYCSECFSKDRAGGGSTAPAPSTEEAPAADETPADM